MSGTADAIVQPVRISRALISVSDKTGLPELARALHAAGTQIISTGGTAGALAAAGIPVTPIEELTGFPEMLDGRVKTLHPRVHGGLLGLRDNPSHLQAMTQHGIQPIDLVCVNLYPFERTIATPGVSEHDAIEQIDIGGPSMLRSAAKNFRSVTVLTDPRQYADVIRQLQEHDGCTTLPLRRQLAAAVFARTAAYDAAIATWMEQQDAPRTEHAGDQPEGRPLPRTLRVTMPLVQELRYGENPHQRGAVYHDTAYRGPGVVGAPLLHGKPLSYNNLLDAAAALELVQDLHPLRDTVSATAAEDSRCACAVIKHTNPCGAALDANPAAAFTRAWAGDPLAAFGGVVAFSATVDHTAATAMVEGERFLEVIVAPGFTPEALNLLQGRWKNVRLLAVGAMCPPPRGELALRSIPGGLLVQERDALPIDGNAFTHVAGPAPTPAMRRDAAAMFVVVKHLKSNAVCIGYRGALMGAGAGQMDRVASCRNAVLKAQEALRALTAVPAGAGASRTEAPHADAESPLPVAASDAFFPFADGPEVLIDAGVRCIVHPGGSKRDQDTFDLCNARGVTCLLTGTRHFRH